MSITTPPAITVQYNADELLEYLMSHPLGDLAPPGGYHATHITGWANYSINSQRLNPSAYGSESLKYLDFLNIRWEALTEPEDN